jgi:hypothetical protein
VTTHSCSTRALIVDPDLGFLMWLGELFADLGCQAVPAFNCRQALALIERLDLSITILVIDPELRGAKRMVKVLTAANPGLRLVLIRGAAAHKCESQGNGLHPTPNGIQARFTLERPCPGEDISRPDWTARIRKLLI